MGAEHSLPSPPYPAYSLPAVVERALRLTTLPVGTPLSRKVVLAALGFGSANGTSKSYINALKQFRLVIGKGAMFEVSPEVLHLRAETPLGERRELLADLARRPTIFRELDDRYPDALGQHGDQARAFLATNGFRQAAIGTVLAAYRSTREMLVREGVDSVPPLHSGSANVEPAHDNAMSSSLGEASSMDKRMLFSYAFEGGGDLKVIVDGSVGVEEVINTIESWLTLKRAELSRIRST